MKMIDVLHMPRRLWLGRKTEQNFRPIAFDVYKWLTDYPEATVSIIYTRPDGQIFPVASSDRSPIIWIPQQDVTTVSGEGEIELHLVGGGAVGISASTKTLIDDSAASAQPTAPSWVDQVVQDVTEHADRAEAAVSHYPQIVNGVWFVWDAEQSEFVSTGISAQGEDGVSPTVTVEAITGGHRVTITDASGDHTFDVLDGESGGGSGGVSSYNDLEDAPMSVEPGAKFDEDDNIGTGVFGPRNLVKVSDKHYPLAEVIGAKIVLADGTEMTADAQHTFDVTTTMNQSGATGDSWALVSLSGNWMRAFDAVLLSCNGAVNFDMGPMQIVLDPGTYVLDGVQSVAMPDKMVVNEVYENLFLPDASVAGDRKTIVTSGGSWVISARTPAAGVSEYRNIQRIIGGEHAESYFPLWSQIKAMHSVYGEIAFDVVNHDTTNKEVTIMMTDLIDGHEFDATEALAVCPEGLAAGTYQADSYVFTLTKDVPSNGVLVFTLNGSYVVDGLDVYASIDSLDVLEHVGVSNSGSGTALSTAVGSDNVNNVARACYGSGNYLQSGIYKWLSATGSDWWTPSHKFDRPPSYVNEEGFLGGFDPEFVAMLADTNRVCATNGVYEIGTDGSGNDLVVNGSYFTSGKFFLPSYTELTGRQNNSIAEGTAFQAFDGFGTSNAGFIKRLNGQPWYYWARSCRPTSPEYARYVSNNGFAGNSNFACTAMIGFAAACVIQGI